MIRAIAALLIAALAASNALAEANTPGRYVVTATTLNIRLAPNTAGQAAGSLRQGQEIEVLEVDNGWARISEYYDGARDGVSGTVASRVFAEHLGAGGSAQAPVELPAAAVEVDVDSPVYRAIESSDDLDKYQGLFVLVSEKLVESGACNLSDFRDIGGWWRSTSHQPRPVYYTYCGGATDKHRIFVDTQTGQVFR